MRLLGGERINLGVENPPWVVELLVSKGEGTQFRNLSGFRSPPSVFFRYSGSVIAFPGMPEMGGKGETRKFDH